MSKSPAKLTDTEKQSLRNKAKAELERLDSAFSNETTKQKLTISRIRSLSVK